MSKSFVRAVCSRRHSIPGRLVVKSTPIVRYFCDVGWMGSAAGGGALGNVITRRAFSPQLTERTEPKAAEPRNDDTFHEGCSNGRIRERIPVDVSCRREFVYRPSDDGDQSIDFADNVDYAASLRLCFRRVLGRAAIAIYCLSRATSHAGCFGARRSLGDLFQLSFPEVASFLS